jgi:hypothetical protein
MFVGGMSLMLWLGFPATWGWLQERVDRLGYAPTRLTRSMAARSDAANT